MPDKARAEGARYICPQCFTAHYLNDVLFAARRPSGSCDMRQAAHRYAIGPPAAFARWCKAGEAAALLNWRALPQPRRQWENGEITAVRDLDGSWVTQRVCPCCHMPLSSPCPVIIGWGETGLDNSIASDFLYFAAEAAAGPWKACHDDSLPLRYDYLLNSSGTAVLGIPVALERVKDSSGRDYRRRCCESAMGAVVRLKLRVNEGGSLDDIEAFRTLEAMLEACGYSGIELKMLVVFLLEGLSDQPDAVDLFKRECSQLARLIQYDFESCYFIVEPYEHPQAAVQAVEWLSGHISRLNAEE